MASGEVVTRRNRTLKKSYPCKRERILLQKLMLQLEHENEIKCIEKQHELYLTPCEFQTFCPYIIIVRYV